MVLKEKIRRFLILAVLCAVSREIAGWDQYDFPWLLESEDSPDLPLILRGRNADQALEFGAERSQAGIANLLADFSYRHFTGGKQVARVVHSPARKEVMRCFAERGAEHAVEVKRRETCFARRSVQKDLRLVAGSQKITCPAQAAKCFVVHQRPESMSFWHQHYCTEKTAAKSNWKIEKNFVNSCESFPRRAAFHLIFIRGYT
jgi:hypothetical protein